MNFQKMELYPDKLLIFDLKGPLAHFRKFYTNSSSLSYTFPPRTTITGLVAGIIGRERDTYYEEFSSEKCKVALSIRTPVRKVMQTVNYVRTKSLAEVNLSAGPTPIPLEIVLPVINYREIIYRIYFYHSDKIMEEITETLKSKNFIYPPYLGISEFIGEVEFISFIEGEEILKLSDSTAPVDIVSVINIDQILKGGLIFEPESGIILQYVKERMPLEFDSERKLKKAASFIYEKNQNKAKLKIKGNYYRVNYQAPTVGSIIENIVFMEEVI